MIFRNSLLSIIRSRGKTALFTLLIFALTLALALGVSVWASAAQFLEDCDDFYTTIGLVEYMGTGYPDDTGYDAALASALETFDAGVIAEDEAALSWDTPARSFGYVEGFWRTDSYMPYQMLSVLVVGNASYDEENHLYRAIVMNALYSSKSETDSIILIDDDYGAFEPGHYYLVFGEVYRGKTPLLHLRTVPPDRVEALVRGADVPGKIDITAHGADGRYYVLPEDSVLLQLAETLPVTNNSVLVNGTGDLMSLLPFHQQELYIIDGRPFTRDEYENGSRVAVISELMAARLDVGVGDTIELSAAVADRPGVYNSYWAPDGFSYHETFTVAGIMNTVGDKSWYVYVPESAGVPYSQHPIGYTVGQAVIRNRDAGAAAARIEPALGDRFQFTIYDQGYSTVAVPYQIILRIAQIVTAVCVLMVLAAVILFGYLFVYRQRETSETMLMLGAGRRRVTRYFLYSSGIISLAAAAAGAAAGYRLHEGIIDLVARVAENFSLIDSRYSSGNLTISRTLEFAPQLGRELFLFTGAAVFLAAVLACTAFCVSTFLYSRTSQRKPGGPRGQHKTSSLSGGSMKYAFLSILRGGMRTLVVPILAVSVVIFFGQLATTARRYEEQLEAVYDNTTIEGYYTDINGKQIGNQLLNAYDVAGLYHTGMIRDLSVSISEPYYYMGVSKRAGGGEQDIPPLYVPSSHFARESLEAEILRGSDFTATNNIRTAPEFYYADTILMTFMEGYDESILAVPADDERLYSAILPSSLMAEKGIALGDTVRVAFNHTTLNPGDQAQVFQHLDLRVVGSYEKQGVGDTIYAPLAVFFNPALLWDDLESESELPGWGMTVSPEQKKDYLQSTVFHSASFTLADARRLVELKDYLSDYGYSQVQQVSSVREFIVLKDVAFNNSVASLRQQIGYINTLYPCLYVLVGIIAVVVSYLLIVSRKLELATMRGLGATRTGAFFSFFYEQSILCLLGTAAGLLIWQLVWGAPAALHLTLIAGFLICFFTGSAASITIMNYSSVLTLLLDKD